MTDDPVLSVLRAYPQIYHACHVSHPRGRTNTGRLSARDTYVLGHLELDRPTSPAALARHLSVRNSTVSEAVRRLVRLGFAVRQQSVTDKRRVDLFLSAKGAAAMKEGSVLDPERVSRLLAQLPDDEQRAALHGLQLLAKAARSLNANHPKRWNGGGGS